MSREDLLQLINQAAREGWTELNLQGKGITELPAEIGQLSNLIHLRLGNPWDAKANNQLTTLPDSLSQLTNLQTLSLDNNPLIPPLQKRLCDRVRRHTRLSGQPDSTHAT